MRDYYFNIAGFEFSVRLSGALDVNLLLPSFKDFHCKSRGDSLFRLTVGDVGEKAEESGCKLIETSSIDNEKVSIFRTDNGYRVEMSYIGEHSVSTMNITPDFTEAYLSLDSSSGHAGYVLPAMIRMVYSQCIIGRNAASVHASAISKNGKCYLFLGKSGTGKSTHSALWMRYVGDCQLLNDDNPVIRLVNGRVMAWGTPWSGKTPCYKNLCYPVAGIVRLHQATGNSFHCLKEVDAFAALLPSCALLRGESRLAEVLYTTLTRVVNLVPVALLDCRPDKEAALMCYENITKVTR